MHIMYALRRNELVVFRSMCDGHGSVDDLREDTGLSAISIYRAAQSLSSKRLVTIRREGRRHKLSPSSHEHSKALAAYLEGGRRPIEPLVGSRLLVLLSVSSHPKDLDRIAEETELTSESVRRLVWALKNFGAVSQQRQMLSIPQSDVALVRFLRDFSKGACAAVLEGVASAGTVLWSEGLEFVFAARKLDDGKGARETGTTAMSRRGLQFISDTRYYHFALWRPRLRPEAIALHNLLVDPNSTRGIAYSLLFLMKTGCDSDYLLRQGDAVGAGELSRQVVAYLGGKTVKNAHFPSRSDLEELRAQYGVG